MKCPSGGGGEGRTWLIVLVRGARTGLLPTAVGGVCSAVRIRQLRRRQRRTYRGRNTRGTYLGVGEAGGTGWRRRHSRGMRRQRGSKAAAAVACVGEGSYGDGDDGDVGRAGVRVPGVRATGGGGGQRAYLRGPSEAGDTGWWRRLVLCRGGCSCRVATAAAQNVSGTGHPGTRATGGGGGTHKL
jgi:hypothetical protein